MLASARDAAPTARASFQQVLLFLFFWPLQYSRKTLEKNLPTDSGLSTFLKLSPDLCKPSCQRTMLVAPGTPRLRSGLPPASPMCACGVPSQAAPLSPGHSGFRELV